MNKKYVLSSLVCLSLVGCSVSNPKVEEQKTTYSALYEENQEDSHAILVENETKDFDLIEVNKTGDSASRDEADFYGLNAAVLAQNKGKVTITNSLINTNGEHANAVFAYGEDSVIDISDSIINTTKNNSGGIMVTGGATLNAKNLTIQTQGGSSAAIRSDRGGGNLNVEGGTYSSYGSGSPAIYSTANITVQDAQLYSDISQAVVVEGANSVTLNNCNATGKNTFKNSDNSNYYQAVMLYQSMSGDADQGTTNFTMIDGSLTSQNEGMFFVTNTVANINLENVLFNYASDDFLRICAAGWGNEGNNGGQVTMNTKNQEMEGNVLVDSVSNLNLLMDSSSFIGSVQGDGDVYVELKNGSTWKLTEDSTIKSLTCDADSIDLNGHELRVNGEEYTQGNPSSGDPIEVVVQEKPNRASPTGNGEERPSPPGDSDNRPTPPGDDKNPPSPPKDFNPGEEPPKKPEE